MREDFDLDPGLIYLNSGTHSVCPRVVRDAVTRYQRDYERNPTAGLFDAMGKLWQRQKELAQFFRADPLDLFLRTNVTMALNAFILGMPLPAGGEILLSDLEYGAIAKLCRFRAEGDGLKMRAFHLPLEARELEALTPQKIVDSVLGAVRPETKLLVLSHVISAHGLVLPIDDIARETRRRGILLAVDGAHAPGALDLDFSRLSDVDFYGGNLHKWMMGPKGTGFGWLNKRHHSALRPIIAGWTSYDPVEPHTHFAAGHDFQMKMLLSSCHDFAPFFAIREMLGWWSSRGAEKVRARIGQLQSFTEGLMRREGWESLSPAPGPLRGPLLSYALPPRAQAEGYRLMGRLLREHSLQIHVSQQQGQWRLRLSPHVYNSEAEIERGVAFLRPLIQDLSKS